MSEAFDARVFGDGHPDAGTPARARFIGERLCLDGGVTADAATVEVDAAGFNQEDVILRWQGPSGPVSLMITAPQAKRLLVASAPPPLRARLRRWQGSVTTTRRVWQVLGAAAVVAGIGFTLAVWNYDRVVAWAAEHVSLENERRMGLGVMTGLRREGRLVDQGRAVDVVREIGGRLTQGSARTYEWYVKDDPGVNAFAVPGGFVVVHAGLLHAAGSPEEVAGVLAHEVQHIEQRHALQGLLYQLGWATLLTVALGDATALTTLMLLELGNLKFSRELEARADAAGVESLRRAGIDPNGLVAFFRRLQDGGAPALSWLSTHPATGERIAAIEAAIRQSPCPRCAPLPYEWREVRQALVDEGLMRGPVQARNEH